MSSVSFVMLIASESLKHYLRATYSAPMVLPNRKTIKVFLYTHNKEHRMQSLVISIMDKDKLGLVEALAKCVYKYEVNL